MADLQATTDLLQLFGEPTRVRLVALLSDRELTVADLVAITDLAQSRVSQHLGKLREAGVLRDRKVATSTYYSLSPAMPADARAVWDMIAPRLDDRVLASDRARLEKRLSGSWTDALAGQMERHYSPGRTWESLARALVPLVRLGDVLDAGCGDGTIAELLVPRAKSITCLDSSEVMIDAAKKRLGESARFFVGDAQELPFDPHRFDVVLLFNVLVFVPDPARAIAEAARVLRAHGEIVVVTIDAHDHEDVARAWGHAHRGFSIQKLKNMFKKAALEIDSCEITSRERREPQLSVITAHAHKS